MDTAADRGPRPLPPAAFSAAPEAPAPPPGAGSAATAADAQEATFLAPFERVFATLKRMASNYATLAVLDAQRAAMQFAWVVAGGIFVSVLLVTAWLAGVVALAVWLLGSGMSWPAVLLIAAGLNVVGAAVVAMMIRGKFDSSPFAATLRQIKTEPEKKEETK
ncbi:MAG TPA: phage holin family protein [Burkholderiales bacterium]|nr:phage holin family protein [Burkholderiales bacterium]